MPKKASSKPCPAGKIKSAPDDPDQFQRFLEMEKQVGAEYDEADFDAKVKEIGRHKPKDAKNGPIR